MNYRTCIEIYATNTRNLLYLLTPCRLFWWQSASVASTCHRWLLPWKKYYMKFNGNFSLLDCSYIKQELRQRNLPASNKIHIATVNYVVWKVRFTSTHNDAAENANKANTGDMTIVLWMFMFLQNKNITLNFMGLYDIICSLHKKNFETLAHIPILLAHFLVYNATFTSLKKKSGSLRLASLQKTASEVEIPDNLRHWQNKKHL